MDAAERTGGVDPETRGGRKARSDPDHYEGKTEYLKGMGLLPVDTVFTADKSRTRVQGTVQATQFAGVQLDGYEIHMGVSTVKGDPFCELTDGTTDRKTDGCVRGNVFGTYLHGLFDTGELTETLIRWLAQRKGIDPGEMQIIPHEVYVQQQYDILAEGVRKVLDIGKIYEIMDRYEITDR